MLMKLTTALFGFLLASSIFSSSWAESHLDCSPQGDYFFKSETRLEPAQPLLNIRFQARATDGNIGAFIENQGNEPVYFLYSLTRAPEFDLKKVGTEINSIDRSGFGRAKSTKDQLKAAHEYWFLLKGKLEPFGLAPNSMHFLNGSPGSFNSIESFREALARPNFEKSNLGKLQPYVLSVAYSRGWDRYFFQRGLKRPSGLQVPGPFEVLEYAVHQGKVTAVRASLSFKLNKAFVPNSKKSDCDAL